MACELYCRPNLLFSQRPKLLCSSSRAFCPFRGVQYFFVQALAPWAWWPAFWCVPTARQSSPKPPTALWRDTTANTRRWEPVRKHLSLPTSWQERWWQRGHLPPVWRPRFKQLIYLRNGFVSFNTSRSSRSAARNAIGWIFAFFRLPSTNKVTGKARDPESSCAAHDVQSASSGKRTGR